MSPFKEDRLENEKHDPLEGSAPQYIVVPLFLLAMFLGFGMTYIGLRTPQLTMSAGDSRTSSSPLSHEGEQTTEIDLQSLLQKGKQVYASNCQACHQGTGSGIPGAFPPLSESEWVGGSADRMAAIVIHGLQGEITVKGQTFQGVMPPFKDTLSVEEIAAVTTYVRQSFGNQAEAIFPEEVERVISETGSQAGPWNGEEELNRQDWN